MIFTSEQVSCGHPDKICDQISDAIVTDCLAHDKKSRVAAECMIKDFEVIIAGEITSSHQPDYEALARGVLKRIGVFGAEDFRIQTFISKQSEDIALGVDGNAGAGDQGMMFGYATNETPEMLPIPYAVATHALRLLREVGCPILLPDAKSLTELGIPTVKGLTVWTPGAVYGILKNEKYCGEVLMQKTYTPDCLTHRSVKNTGQERQYVMHDYHPAIVSKEDWNEVQRRITNKEYIRRGKQKPPPPPIALQWHKRGKLKGFLVLDPNWRAKDIPEVRQGIENRYKKKG